MFVLMFWSLGIGVLDMLMVKSHTLDIKAGSSAKLQSLRLRKKLFINAKLLLKI